MNRVTKIEDVGYYDLIELPSGSHIPAPIALKLVGIKEISKIPVSRRKRDEHFFYCPECEMTDFFKHTPCSHCSDYDCDNCPVEKELEEYYKTKEIVFVHLIRTGQHRKLRYIKAV